MMKLNNANQVWDLIKQAQCIAVTTHLNPDGDAIGSLIAFYEGILSLGKKSYMVLDDEVLPKYSFLQGVSDIQRVDNELPEPDLLVVLDASTKERIGRVGEKWDTLILNIDHHISNEGFADYLYLLPEYAATGEILVDLLQQEQITITSNMASALYMAIATDCGFFKFSNTTSHTLEMAGICVAQGAMVQSIAEMVDMMSLERFEAVQSVMQTIEFFKEGYVGIMSLPLAVMEKINHDSDGFVDYVRNVEGVELAVLLKEQDENRTKLSLRSKSIDVNRIANKFGGGGHVRASGCTINAPLREAKEIFLKALDEEF